MSGRAGGSDSTSAYDVALPSPAQTPELIIASRQPAGRSRRRHSEGPESYKVTGAARLRILHDAKERAHNAGAKSVEERPIVGAPVDALVNLADRGEGGPACPAMSV